jgi:hypothetical protein
MMSAFSPAANAQDDERPPPGFADPVLGSWDIVVEGENGPYPSWIEVRLRTEWSLMAQFVGQFGSARHVTAIEFQDGEFGFRVPVQYEPGQSDLVFEGRLMHGGLAGQVTMGDGTALDWSAARAPSLDRGDEPRWGKPVALIGDGLSGWRMRDERYPGCWSVSDGILSVTPPCVDIITEAVVDDFRLQLEFRYPEGSNSGVYLRGRYEVQIQDDYGKPTDPLRIGGVYGFLAPAVNAAKPAGEWQSYEIELIGRRISVSLNGREIVSDRVIPGITGGALDSDEGSPGPLMLQGDHGAIEYRNIVITPAL